MHFSKWSPVEFTHEETWTDSPPWKELSVLPSVMVKFHDYGSFGCWSHHKIGHSLESWPWGTYTLFICVLTGELHSYISVIMPFLNNILYTVWICAFWQNRLSYQMYVKAYHTWNSCILDIFLVLHTNFLLFSSSCVSRDPFNKQY